MLLLLPGTASVYSQDEDLGDLPPMPLLDLGYPDQKLSFRQKRLAERREQLARKAENADQGRVEVAGRATLGQRLSASGANAKRKTVSQAITVQNSLPSGEDGITASGSRLRPFGDDRYWGEMPPPTPEESLIDLPPAPDLRTPDQITRRERIRNMRVSRFEERKAETEAAREDREMRARAVVNRPQADPSTALVQVESQSSSGAGFAGNVAAPQTVTQGSLKPFNERSTFYQDNQIVYKGGKPNSSSAGRAGNGTSGQDSTESPKWRLRNPFKSGAN